MMDGWMDGWMDINNETPPRRWWSVADTSQTMLREEAAGREEVGGPGTKAHHVTHDRKISPSPTKWVG